MDILPGPFDWYFAAEWISSFRNPLYWLFLSATNLNSTEIPLVFLIVQMQEALAAMIIYWF